MKAYIASELGFCIGVKRAFSLLNNVYNENKGMKDLYVYGDLAHNKHVMDHVYSLGFKTIYSPDEATEGSLVVVRAHGISDEKRSAFLKKGVELIDATCPLVLKNQNYMRTSELDVILFGLKNHSETVAVEGAAKGRYYLVENVEDIDAIPKDRRYRVIVQTTFESEKYSMLLKELDERGYSYIVSNSICMASEKRREAVRAFKGKVDLLIVIGDKKSANSNALVAEAKGVGLEAFLCEDADDLDIERLKGVSSVAISAGSSTPDNIIEEVVRRIEEL